MDNHDNLEFLQFIETYFKEYEFRYGDISINQKILYLFGIYDECNLLFCTEHDKIEDYCISIFQGIFHQIKDGDFDYSKLDITNIEYKNLPEIYFKVFIDNCIYSIMDYFGNLKKIEKDRLYICLEYDLVFLPVREYNDTFLDDNIFNHYMKILELGKIHSCIFNSIR